MVNQDDIIKGFVEHLGKVRNISLSITSWPDKNNRTVKEIDAIAENENVKIAIEHTSIDSFPDQRKDDARFLLVMGSIEKELSGKFEAEIKLIIKCFAIPTGKNWTQIKKSLIKWLEENLPFLPDGENYHKIDGVPFDVYITKDSKEMPEFNVSRFSPDIRSFSDCIINQLKGKIKKLKKYKKNNYETILLIEGYDPGLMSKNKMKMGVREALIKIEEPHPDQIWFVKTYIPGKLKFYLI